MHRLPQFTAWLSIPCLAGGDTAYATHKQIWGNGTGDDATGLRADRVRRSALLVVYCLHNQLYVWRDPKKFWNGVRRPGQQSAFKENNVGRVPFQRGAQIVERISLSHHTDVVFERKDLADSNPVDCLGVRKDNADGSRLYWRVQNFAVRRFRREFP